MATIGKSDSVGIYIDGKRVAIGRSVEFTGDPIIDVFEKPSKEHKMTFEGLFIHDDNPDMMTIEYTVRRKEKVYFKAVNHPYVNSLSVDAPGVSEKFKDIKKGTRFTGRITEIMQ